MTVLALYRAVPRFWKRAILHDVTGISSLSQTPSSHQPKRFLRGRCKIKKKTNAEKNSTLGEGWGSGKKNGLFWFFVCQLLGSWPLEVLGTIIEPSQTWSSSFLAHIHCPLQLDSGFWIPSQSYCRQRERLWCVLHDWKKHSREISPWPHLSAWNPLWKYQRFAAGTEHDLCWKSWRWWHRSHP